MTIKEITLVFETCDYADIPIDLVQDMTAQHSWGTMTCDGSGHVAQSMECSAFSLTLAGKAGELVTRFRSDGEPDGVALKEKIPQRDVVFAELHTDDDEAIRCDFTWRDDGHGSNAAMVIHTADDSEISFTIS